MKYTREELLPYKIDHEKVLSKLEEIGCTQKQIDEITRLIERNVEIRFPVDQLKIKSYDFEVICPEPEFVAADEGKGFPGKLPATRGNFGVRSPILNIGTVTKVKIPELDLFNDDPLEIILGIELTGCVDSSVIEGFVK